MATSTNLTVAILYEATYRPFVKADLYFDYHLNEMQYQLARFSIGEREHDNCILLQRLDERRWHALQLLSNSDTAYSTGAAWWHAVLAIASVMQ